MGLARWLGFFPAHARSAFALPLSSANEERVRGAYAREARDRLAKLKNTYDPTNLFRLNQNIKPSL